LIAGPASTIFAHGGRRIFRADDDVHTRTLAGGNTQGFSGDGGPAVFALMANGEAETAQGLAIDADGNLFFHDAGNRRIRVIRYGAVLPPPNATIEATKNGSVIFATVKHPDGRPARAVRVEFAAPASGASCTVSSSFAITDANGVAQVSCTPNCMKGSYAVTARPLAAPAVATVAFTNDACPPRRRAARH